MRAAAHSPLSQRIDRLHGLLQCMLRIREFENTAEQASQGGVAVFGQGSDGHAAVRGPLHLSTGQEAVPAGVCHALRRDDLLTSTHRGHGHTLAKGADAAVMMAELHGRASGYSGGRGGSMHIADFSVGMLGANGVVAAGLPIAVGAAHALKLQRKPSVVACFFGDGAINRGPFLEALNWAAVHQLPLLFVCEDNRWSATTDTRTTTAGAGASARAEALAVPSVSVDGNDVEAVADQAQQLVALARAGGGPQLLHALTYRFKGHVSVDAAAYRDASLHAQALRNDPIERAAARWLELGGSAGALQALRDGAAAEMSRAAQAARLAAVPQRAAAFSEVQTTGEGQWF
jgi:acetoin:2,6-dichlorophenolindophenol oxidoreductase subunit alpha